MKKDLLKQITLTLLHVMAGLLSLHAGGMKLFDWFGGDPAVLLCFIFLFFTAYGAGPWSIDGLLRRRKPLP